MDRCQDIKIIPLQHEQTRSEEDFVAVIELDGGEFVFGIIEASEVTHYGLLDTALITGEAML